MPIIGRPAAVLVFVLATIGSSAGLSEVTVTARPFAPEWKKWNPYGGIIRVEEEKWPDVPCGASWIAAGAATSCKTGPLLSHAGVGLPGGDRSVDLSNCRMAHDLVITTLGSPTIEADVIVIHPYFVSAIGPQHKGCAAQSGYSDLREEFPDMNRMTRNGGGWRNFIDNA